MTTMQTIQAKFNRGETLTDADYAGYDAAAAEWLVEKRRLYAAHPHYYLSAPSPLTPAREHFALAAATRAARETTERGIGEALRGANHAHQRISAEHDQEIITVEGGQRMARGTARAIGATITHEWDGSRVASQPR